jgi:hypothetical protein
LVPAITFVAEKYFVGEAYSGTRKATILEKAEQLESAIETLARRYAARVPSWNNSPQNICSLVSGDILCFAQGSKSRSDAVKERRDWLAPKISLLPYLNQIRSVGRLGVMVLSASGCCVFRVRLV